MSSRRDRAMKRAVVAAAAAGVLISAGAARAAPIPPGELSINGDDSYSAASVTFLGLGNVGDDTGPFGEIAPCDACVTLIGSINTLTTSGTLFTASSSGKVASFSLEGPLVFDFTANPNPNLDLLTVEGEGLISLTGFDPTLATFALTTQGSTNTSVTFSATVAAVPAPPIGGLGAAVGGVLWLAWKWFRRSMQGSVV